ncbi:MarR family winged helix-turn-helix transcriptional regulator [Falsiruegeria mediterranea]|jgi:DNA-binding MarR family transcriptional regulator|uniref:Putative HTH-type transcriptional regulator n=1 Tax=Falsiruegeria mediterranea M17 TaxID=1200281 RepID=A0A2R8C7T3_9RHOB|nr:MarR family transcriptional regulator [Falsiruegeria mediterranea]SPJ28507.1 putative HTH-type transcriptional regulator [Falsiruegeria mediterranea M17]
MSADQVTDTEFDIPLQQMVTFRLSRIHAKLNAQAARILKETAGISLSQWRIFVMIETHGKITPAQIVKRTDFDKGQVSRTVKGMLKEGLIVVEGSESDQRSHTLEFTDKGYGLFQQARPAMRTRQTALLGSLTANERQVMFTAMDKLELAMEQIEEESRA